MSDKDQKEKLKKIVYYDTPKKHADLKIRWQYDGVRQSEFFRMLVDAYLNKDERILSVMDDHKTENKIQNKQKRAKTQKIYQERQEVVSKFALEDAEVESIFDLLEKEHPDL